MRGWGYSNSVLTNIVFSVCVKGEKRARERKGESIITLPAVTRLMVIQPRYCRVCVHSHTYIIFIHQYLGAI